MTVRWLRRHRPAWHGNDLSGWHAVHRSPDGDVWAVTPPCGYRRWYLYPPGAPDGAYPYYGAIPVADHPASAEFGGDSDRTVLADVEAWMRPWIERVTSGRVAEMVEGWGEPYGPRRDLHEYVIYARVVSR